MFFKKIKRRDIMSLQLTAMIDVFALIIIFLMKGSVFGVSAIPIPPDLTVPDSISHEEIEIAPTVGLDKDKVVVSFLNESQEVPLAWFRPENSENPDIVKYKEKVKSYIDGLAPENRAAGVLLNVVADKTATYKDIFDVVVVFRAAGFESVLFIAKGT